MKRDFIVDDFYEVSKEKGISFEVLSGEENEILYQKLFDQFFEEGLAIQKIRGTTFWEFLKEDGLLSVGLPYIASYREFFLRQLNGLDYRSKLCFIFDYEYMQNILVFNKMEEITSILEDSYNFNFYIFDKDLTFLVAWCDEEILFGSGAAQECVQKIEETWSDCEYSKRYLNREEEQ